MSMQTISSGPLPSQNKPAHHTHRISIPLASHTHTNHTHNIFIPPPILHTIFTVPVASHKARKIGMGLTCCGCSEQPQGGSIVSMRLRIYHQDFYIKKYEACFLYISNFLMQVSCQAIWIDLNFINNVYSNLITSVGINK